MSTGNKVGRPSKYKTIDLKKVQILASKGFIDDEIADFFGIAKATLSLYKEKHPEFSEAIKSGKLESDTRVERSLFERACGFEHPEEKIFCNDGKIVRTNTIKKYPPDPVSMIFWLKNRKPDVWRDRQEIDHTLDVEGVTINVVKKYPAALEAEIVEKEALPENN